MRRHEKSKSHVGCVSAKTRSSSLLDMGFTPVGSAVDKQVLIAILKWELAIDTCIILHINFRQRELR